MLSDHMPNHSTSQARCSPCQYADIFKPAKYVCIDCSENLCAECKLYHLRKKVTRAHTIAELLSLDPVESNSQSQLKNSEERPGCACGLREIEAYCKGHHEAVCRTCKTGKHENCDTCTLIELTESIIINKMEHVAKTAEENQIKLENLLMEGEEALRFLMNSYENCNYDISQIANMSYEARLYGKDRELKSELNYIMSKHRRTLEDQIEACRVSLAKLSNQLKRTQKYKVSEERDKALNNVLQLSNILKDITGIIEKMDGNIKKTKLVFKANEKLDILRALRVEKWGEIKLETAEKLCNSTHL